MSLAEAITVIPAGLRDQTQSAPAILVLPGGGYAGHAPHEGEAIGNWLSAQGWHAFVLRYPVSPDEGPEPLHPAPLEAAVAAMRWIRSAEHGLAVSHDQVGAIGFSAGGHLTASLSHADRLLDAPDAVPNFAVVCYPVISLTHQAHAGSRRRLAGPDPSEQTLHDLSLANQVHPGSPPTFIWHTADDEVVLVSNALDYAAAFARHQVPFELHVYPHGVHGLGLSINDPATRSWATLCGDWIRRQVAAPTS